MNGVYGIGYLLEYKSTCSAMRKDSKLINIASILVHTVKYIQTVENKKGDQNH